jgi:hypothetical protein
MGGLIPVHDVSIWRVASLVFSCFSVGWSWDRTERLCIKI